MTPIGVREVIPCFWCGLEVIVLDIAGPLSLAHADPRCVMFERMDQDKFLNQCRRDRERLARGR